MLQVYVGTGDLTTTNFNTGLSSADMDATLASASKDNGSFFRNRECENRRKIAAVTLQAGAGNHGNSEGVMKYIKYSEFRSFARRQMLLMP